MTLRRGIVFTALLPVFAIIALWLSFRFYWPLPSGLRSYSSHDFVVYGEDGTLLPGTAFRTEGTSKRGTAVVVPDAGLDRDWNAKGAAFRTGAFVGRYLAGLGFDVFRYDQRGTGRSEISGRLYPNLERQVDDFNLVVQEGIKDNPGAAVTLIGHGAGCSVVLRAAVQMRPPPRRIVLFSCGYAGSLLDHWGERVFGNMEELRADPELVKASRLVWRDYVSALRAGRPAALPAAPARYAKNPDWLGFEAAVKSLGTPERKDWAAEAPRVFFKDDLETALRVARVDHYLPQFEEEIPTRERDALVRLTQSIKAASYFFQILPGTGHFLKEQDRSSVGPIDRLVMRSSPFRKPAPSFLEALRRLD